MSPMFMCEYVFSHILGVNYVIKVMGYKNVTNVHV